MSKREINKTKHKTAILDAAEALFIQKGFDNTSIDDVAKSAGLTKRTLYQYFLSKEDLYFAVALKAARILTDAYEEGFHRGTTAMEKIHLANDMYLRFYKEYQDLFKLLNYQPSNRENSEASPHFHELQLLDGLRIRHFVNLVGEAREDGSINPALDPKNAVFFAFFSAFSLLNTLSLITDTWDMLGLEEDEFIRFCFDRVTSALK